MRQSLKCLVIDDSVALCSVLCSTLKDYGVAVADFHSDPRTALTSISSNPDFYDAVFVDLHMEGIDGMDLIKRLQAVGYKGAVIIISALEKRIVDYASDLIKQYDVHLIGTLLKPIQPESVAFVLQRVRLYPRRVNVTKSTVSKDDLLSFVQAGNIVAYGQPKFDAKTSKIQGVELLMRIRDESGRVLVPADFMAVAEESHLLDDMLSAMLDRSLPEMAAFTDIDGRAPCIAINLSPTQLFDDDLPHRLQAILERHHISKERVMLEITENIALIDNGQLANLNRLRIHGFKLSLDDFGVGFTSISQLKAMPINEVKLDRRFVNGVGDDQVMADVARTICTLCHKLNMTLVAEGIEQHDDLALLESIGVDIYQGFLFCRPKPLDELLRWCKIWNKRLGGYASESDPHSLLASNASRSLGDGARSLH